MKNIRFIIIVLLIFFAGSSVNACINLLAGNQKCAPLVAMYALLMTCLYWNLVLRKGC